MNNDEHNSLPATPPATLAGFEHIQRYWDWQLKAWVARIHPGEYYVTCLDEIIGTILGSCVTCCLRDPAAGIAGMNHFMLPETPGKPDWGGGINAATRYGSYAMECLVNAILRHGGRRERLEAKLFGGSQVIPNLSDIGHMNIRFAHEYLAREGIPLIAEDTGGERGRKILYLAASGRVRVRQLSEIQPVLEREKNYRRNLISKPIEGQVELFEDDNV